MKIFDNLETTQWLLAPGTVANSPGVTAIAASIQSQPGVECAFFELSPLAPNANAYWYRKLGADPELSRFEYSARLLFPSDSDAEASQCIEMDSQQVIAGLVFNPAIQLDFADGKVRLWDRIKGNANDPTAWGPVADLTRWPANSWHPIELEAQREVGGFYYQAIIVDGVRTPIYAFHAALVDPSQPDMLNVGIQLDGNASKTQYRVMVDAVKLVAWP
jgi:hypothetical protein